MNTQLRFFACSLLIVLGCGEDGLNTVPPEDPPKEITEEDPPPPPVWEPEQPPPEDLPPATVCQTGAIMGRVCAPGSSTALAGAHVYAYAADCLGQTQLVETITADNGHFSLVGIPAGTHTFWVETAASSYSFEATVEPGEIGTVDADEPGAPLCLDDAPPRLAVITGSWDAVDLLLDTLELSYDIYDGYYGGASGKSEAHDLLTDPELMAEYDVIFVACGDLERDFLYGEVDYTAMEVSFDFTAETYKNLRDFVLHGGNVYASDWGWPVAEGLNSSAIDFYGDERNGVEPLVGKEAGISADIMDEPLEMFMATDDVAIDFDLPGWAVIEDVGAQTKVYVQGNATLEDPDTLATTTLTDRPLLVGYRPFAGGGYVIYTTFHYHAQPSAEMLDVLRFLIFQL